MADARLVIRIVRSPVRGQFAMQICAFVVELCLTKPVPRLRTRLLADFVQLVADLADGGVPGNPCPLAVHQLHRIPQTAIAVHEFASRGALGAMRTTIDWA